MAPTTTSTTRRIETLVVLHHYGNRDDLDERSRTAASRLSADQKQKVTWVRHPLVRIHHGTGRKALYAVSGSSFEIEGMPRDEGVALLDDLKRHALQERYLFSYAYDVGDVVLWDDLATLHSATLTDPDDPRTLWRVTVKEPEVVRRHGCGFPVRAQDGRFAKQAACSEADTPFNRANVVEEGSGDEVPVATRTISLRTTDTAMQYARKPHASVLIQRRSRGSAFRL